MNSVIPIHVHFLYDCCPLTRTDILSDIRVPLFFYTVDDSFVWDKAKMKTFRLMGKTDEQLVAEYSVALDDRTLIPVRLLNAILDRQTRMADRKTDGPGTLKNPI